MKKIIAAGLCILAILIAILLVNTWRYKAETPSVSEVTLLLADETAPVERLAAAIRIKTISFEDETHMDTHAFVSFHRFLEDAFPAIHEQLDRNMIHDYSLLYKWEGSNPALKPMALLAHFDVVPVEPGTENSWTHPAFSGEIADGFVWGRGTLDMKASLLAIMESIEILVQQGFQPERTLYLALGHDEETGGLKGAANIVSLLKKNGVELAFTLDEGMFILDKELSPSKKPLAIIGLAEKGYVTLRITAKGQGGHSSMPPAKTALGSLGRAIAALEKNQMPSSLAGPVKYLFDAIGPDLPFGQKLVFANQWAFKPLILKILEKMKTTNAMIRTTTAPTVISGGVKANVLPASAYALVNFRILPGDTVKEVITHVQNVIDDPDIEISIEGKEGIDPSPVSSPTAEDFRQIQRTIMEIFPGTGVAPGLVMAGTDSKHYTRISDNCYRFAPFVLGPEDTFRIHGTNERVLIKNYLDAIRYYTQLIKNTSKK
ncbi:MAG: M20 family peptidase [Proteobacteria bacterium]|nr:M20 family peptidase [Desulfobacula sp.]MBU3954199.1 M20 family peptidase [Pseudomonadota bacterium]MBU4129556.1 M20 family peptidase [Pseudomonadota bacterium]